MKTFLAECKKSAVSLWTKVIKKVSHFQAVKSPSTLVCYILKSPVHSANLKVKLNVRFCLVIGWKSVSTYIFSLWLWCVAEYSLSLCLLTQSLMEEKSYLKGWQRVRQLPHLFFKMVLFSACLSLFFSMGKVNTAAPCPRHSVSRHCPHCLFSFWMCCALLSAAVDSSPAETVKGWGES